MTHANPSAFITALREKPLDDAARSGRLVLDRLIDKNRSDPNLKGLMEALAGSSELRDFLAGVFAGSSFLSGLAQTKPDILQTTVLEDPERLFARVLDDVRQKAGKATSLRDVMGTLRDGKAKVAVLIALCDLGGLWSVEAVTARLSEAADVFVSLALRFLLRCAADAGHLLPADPATPEKGSGLIILGMGKLGAHELNYSSDIDLIIFFNKDIAPLSKPDEATAFFVRLTRDLVHILQERTAEGYVFRTDLRLRPDPGSTQAAISTVAALRYYESQGQNWERAALIKARPIAGDIEAGEEFLTSLRPYIWRKYLDYNAITDIHAMKRQIHAAKGHAEIAVLGHNLKLGRGGIREIEFFVQSQQLIAGGRQIGLRTSQTLEALDKLCEFGWIDTQAAADLKQAYIYLRRLEHRLQMVADHQTHTLPASPDQLAHFARFCGYETGEDIAQDLRHHMELVQRHYAALFEEVPELTPKRVQGNLVFTGDVDDPNTLQTLTDLGFHSPAAAIAVIKSWHYGRYRAMRSVRAREILTEFTPALLEALSETADPDLALSTFDRFLKEIPAAVQLFSMLRSNPALLKLMGQIMGSAPRLANVLSRSRRVMEALLDPANLGSTPSESELRQLLERDIAEAQSYEEKLNRARVLGQEQAFAIGVAELSRKLNPAQAGRQYALLAESLIEILLEAVQSEFDPQNRFPAPAVIAMGKLGGREMTASSDLDLIIVYQTPADLAAAAPQHYSRLTQRLISALSAQTAEGKLYDVDMRLRPSGKAGPVAIAFEGFSSYQRHNAWTWEHLALTRARAIAGSKLLCDQLNQEIRSILALPRDARKVAADVLDMRQRILKEKQTDDIWDIRNYTGGQIEIEFLVQFLQIVHAHHAPDILDQNTITALKNLRFYEILSIDDATSLEQAAELYQAIIETMRLCAEGRFVPEKTGKDFVDLLLKNTGHETLTHLEKNLLSNYKTSKSIFDKIIQI